ncbi:hypothetical protein GQ42DRAFT_159450 [Ramicandelaber brevisporus]|nr:hypothetical protein GQ42DRAFT_159450 [Ramicandelaber brevisporus]
MGGATMYCVLCGYPSSSYYAEGNPYVEDIRYLDDIVVLLKDGSFTAVGKTSSDDDFGFVQFPDGTCISSIDFVGEGTDRGFMMHQECSFVLREAMGSNGVSVYNWLCDNVKDCNNNTIDRYRYDEYKCDSREDQFWFSIFPWYGVNDKKVDHNDNDNERKKVNMALFYASPNIDGFVYNQSVINTVSDEQPSILNLIFDLTMFDMFIDYKDVITLAGTSKLLRGQIAKDKRYWKRVHNYRKFKLDEDINFDQMVQKLHSPNVMKRSRLQRTVQYILDRCNS